MPPNCEIIVIIIIITIIFIVIFVAISYNNNNNNNCILKSNFTQCSNPGSGSGTKACSICPCLTSGAFPSG